MRPLTKYVTIYRSKWGCIIGDSYNEYVTISAIDTQPTYEVTFLSHKDKAMKENSNTTCYDWTELCEQTLTSSQMREYLYKVTAVFYVLI